MSNIKPILARLLMTGAVGWLSTSAAAMVGGYKTPADFLPLEAYASVEGFELSYAPYVQTCLDNTGGGSAAQPCFIGYEMWDRELNTYYQKLLRLLDDESKTQLRDSQRKWIAMRDASIEFNSGLLDRKYTEPGTMYHAMRAADADAAITPLIKNRALSLKRWVDSLDSSSPSSQEAVWVEEGKFVTSMGTIPAGCIAQLKTDLNGDNTVAAVFLESASFRGCLRANFPYPGGDPSAVGYTVGEWLAHQTYSVEVCEATGGSMGKYCDSIVVRFSQRPYQIGVHAKTVLSMEKLGDRPQ